MNRLNVKRLLHGPCLLSLVVRILGYSSARKQKIRSEVEKGPRARYALLILRKQTTSFTVNLVIIVLFNLQ